MDQLTEIRSKVRALLSRRPTAVQLTPLDQFTMMGRRLTPFGLRLLGAIRRAKAAGRAAELGIGRAMARRLVQSRADGVGAEKPKPAPEGAAPEGEAAQEAGHGRSSSPSRRGSVPSTSAQDDSSSIVSEGSGVTGAEEGDTLDPRTEEELRQGVAQFEAEMEEEERNDQELPPEEIAFLLLRHPHLLREAMSLLENVRSEGGRTQPNTVEEMFRAFSRAHKRARRHRHKHHPLPHLPPPLVAYLRAAEAKLETVRLMSSTGVVFDQEAAVTDIFEAPDVLSVGSSIPVVDVPVLNVGAASNRSDRSLSPGRQNLSGVAAYIYGRQLGGAAAGPSMAGKPGPGDAAGVGFSDGKGAGVPPLSLQRDAQSSISGGPVPADTTNAARADSSRNRQLLQDEDIELAYAKELSRGMSLIMPAVGTLPFFMMKVHLENPALSSKEVIAQATAEYNADKEARSTATAPGVRAAVPADAPRPQGASGTNAIRSGSDSRDRSVSYVRHTVLASCATADKAKRKLKGLQSLFEQRITSGASDSTTMK